MTISRRTFVAGAGAAAAAGGLGFYISKKKSVSLPNIVLFISDDMRYDAVGYAGNPIIRTPNMDKLTSEGIAFDNHFVTTSICPVSRASIMSGQYALKHGVYDFNTNMRRQSFLNSFPLLLRKAGYYTGFIGKWGFGSFLPITFFDDCRSFPGQGEYYVKGNPLHITDRITSAALNFLRKRPKDRPFLLIVAHKAPHAPFLPQKRFMELYNDVTVPRVASDTPEGAAAVPEIIGLNGVDSHYQRALASDADYQENVKNYYRLISGIDNSIGLVLMQMQEQGVSDDSTIIHTSDNGLSLGAHRMFGKWFMFDACIRIPLLIHPARRFFEDIKPRREKGLSLNIDLAPTILSMAGLEVPNSMQGKNLLSAWQRDGFYYEHPLLSYYHIVGCTGYRTAEWKYTRYISQSRHEECLFNLTDDPLEIHNLATDKTYDKQLLSLRRQTQQEKKRLSA